MGVFLEEIRDQIVASGIDTEPPTGGLIFNDLLETNSGELTVLYENPAGPFGEKVQDFSGTKYVAQAFEVGVRSVSQLTARMRALAVYNLFQGVRNETFGGTRYISIDAEQPPFFQGRDENDRWIFAVNFTTTKRIS